MRRKVILVAAIIVGAIVLLALIVPWFINAESFRPAIEARLSAALSRQVQIGKLRFSLWAGGIAAENITIADDPAFATQPFVTAKALDIRVDPRPLLLHRQVHIISLTIQQPQVTLIRIGERWNFSSMGTNATASAASGIPGPGAVNGTQAATSQPEIELKQFVLSGGELAIRQPGTAEVLSGLEIKASDVSRGGVFPFSLNVTLPGNGKLALAGSAGPMPAGDMAEMPVQASLKVEHLDLAAYTAQGAALGGAAELNATMRSDGRQAHVEGSGSLSKFVLVKGGTPSPQPVGLTFAADYDLKNQSGELTAADLRFGKSAAHLSGKFQQTGNTSQVNMALEAKEIQAGDVEHVLRALAIALPGGASLKSGTASTSLTVAGPTNAPIVRGSLHVRNLTVTGFDLADKLKEIAALVSFNTGPNTVLQSLDAKLSMSSTVTKLDDLNAVIAGMGSVTGAGALTGQKNLDFHMVAHLRPSGGALGNFMRATQVNLLSNLPFRVEGTTTNPKFVPDKDTIFGTQKTSSSGKAQSKNALGNALNQFFKKKK